jgi:hypothetical protein
LLDVVRRAPRQFGLERTRWTLETVGTACDWLRGYSRSGIGRVLDALDIVLKRGRDHVHSPDPAYAAKRAAIAAGLAAARTSGGTRVALFLDEVTLHRHPSLASAYESRGQAQPRAERSCRTDATSRVIGTLDADTGRVLWRRRRTLTVPALVGFFQAVVAAYPQAREIDLILDNWPVHFHPDLLVALAPQTTPFPFPRPGNWPMEPSPAAQRKWGAQQLPIQLLPLPTYASWLNPIEKLWRWLRQAVVHLHPWADDLPTLYAEAERFLDRFTAGTAACHDLLRYVGLGLPD